MKIAGYEVHPAADLLPLMSEPELAALAESIKTHGQQVPVVPLFPTLAKVELFCRGAPRPGWQGWGDECAAAAARKTA